MPDESLTAEQIEQAGRLLLPAFIQAMRTELHALRNDFNAAMAAQDDRFERELGELKTVCTALNARIVELEKLKWKAMAGWSGLILAATLGFNYAARKLGLR